MIRASALAVLKAIAKEDYQTVIVKAAKLKLLAVKMDIHLKEALPASVVSVINNVLHKLYWTIRVEHSISTALCSLSVSFGTRLVAESNLLAIASLLTLPKLPALR
jgi:hypothetical protein